VSLETKGSWSVHGDENVIPTEASGMLKKEREDLFPAQDQDSMIETLVCRSFSRPEEVGLLQMRQQTSMNQKSWTSRGMS